MKGSHSNSPAFKNLAIPSSLQEHSVPQSGLQSNVGHWSRSEPGPVNQTSKGAERCTGRRKSNGSRSYWMQLPLCKSSGVRVAQLLENRCCIAKTCCVEQVKKWVRMGQTTGWGRGEKSVEAFCLFFSQRNPFWNPPVFMARCPWGFSPKLLTGRLCPLGYYKQDQTWDQIV